MSGVVIVGAGPAGYACALGLAAFGVPSTVLEQNRTVAAGSRATGISRRSLHLLMTCGVADRIMDVAVVQRANQAFVGKRELFTDRTPAEPGKYPRIVNLQQDLFEEMLQEAVRERPLIDVRWEHRVEDVHATDAGVDVVAAGPQGRVHLEADWLIACDGARSGVRRSQGLRLTGVGYDTRFIVVDVRARLPLEHGVRRIWFDPPSNPGGTVIMHEQTRDVWRVDFGIPPDEDDAAALAPEAVRARIRAHLALIGVQDGWEIVWSGDYTATSVALESFRHGRLFFAGDAAHLVPIFGGRGLNSAIEDGFNLAWKLAAVVRQAADPALLDTYSAERASGARQNSAKAGIGAEVIAARSRGSLLLRRAALELMQGVRPSLKSLLGHRTADANTYRGSPLAVPAAGFAGAATPGDVLPDVLASIDGAGQRYVSESLGDGFTVLSVGNAAAGVEVPSTLMGFPVRSVGIHEIVDERLDPASIPPLATGVYLVRPDRYVMAHTPDGTPADLVRSVGDMALDRPAAEGAAR